VRTASRGRIECRRDVGGGGSAAAVAGGGGGREMGREAVKREYEGWREGFRSGKGMGWRLAFN